MLRISLNTRYAYKRPDHSGIVLNAIGVREYRRDARQDLYEIWKRTAYGKKCTLNLTIAYSYLLSQHEIEKI